MYRWIDLQIYPFDGSLQNGGSYPGIFIITKISIHSDKIYSDFLKCEPSKMNIIDKAYCIMSQFVCKLGSHKLVD